MTTGSLPHIILFVATLVFFVLSTVAVSKMRRGWQNVMFVIAALLGSGGIFFRYAMGSSFSAEPNLEPLLIQMLQVCNFNFILLPLMLIPRFELARQYSVFFSMFAAATTLFSLPSSFAAYEWCDVIVLNFWFNHVFAIALPIWMIFAKRLSPRRKYILPVSGLVLAYFTLVYVITGGLIAADILPVGTVFSYVQEPKGMPLLTTLYEWIGMPYVYLLPVLPVFVIFCFLWSLPFKRAEYR